jgi:hypothetical protein
MEYLPTNISKKIRNQKNENKKEVRFGAPLLIGLIF